MSRSLPAIIVLAIAVAGCAGGQPADTAQAAVPGDATVVLRGTRFQPGDVTVEAGTTVTWVWDDGSTTHNVVGDDYQSETKADGSFTHTFTEPGTHPYVCTLHPGMEGTVTVAPAPDSASSPGWPRTLRA